MNLDGGTRCGEWETLSEELIHGLVHAINNRIATISAFTELAAMDGASFEAETVRPEIVRLHETNALTGKLVSWCTTPEPLEVRPVLETAIAIYAHHARANGRACSARQRGPLMPVRVPRYALLRLLLLMLDATYRESTGTVELDLDGSADETRITFPAATPLCNDGVALALSAGATVIPSPHATMLTLAAMRRKAR